jgi:hypothetical protein
MAARLIRTSGATSANHWRYLRCSATIEIARARQDGTAGSDHERDRSASESGPARQALDLPDLCRPFRRVRIEQALPDQSRQGPDRPLRRLRPADPDRLRPRPCALARRGRQGRRSDHPSRRHAGAVRPDSAGADEHLDDDQCDGGLAALALHRHRRRAGRRPRCLAGHHPERPRQRIPVARNLCLPAAPLDAIDHRHRRVHGARTAEMEPDERLLLPSAGGWRLAGAGAILRLGDRDRPARVDQGPAGGLARGVRQRRRPHLLLRQCRHALRHRALQDAGFRRSLGRDHAEALHASWRSSIAASAMACRSTHSG